MQSSLLRQQAGSSAAGAAATHRHAAQPRLAQASPSSSSSSSSSNSSSRQQSRRGQLQVTAAKGQRAATAGMMGGGMGQRVQPPVPEVDPENTEFVVFVRARNYMEGRIPVAEGKWAPLSVVKGGAAANFLVKAMESPWGRMLYSRTLLRQIGSAMYRDRTQIEDRLRESYPPFAKLKSKNFSYGFKVRDQNNPKDWSKTEGVTEFPPEDTIAGTAATDFQNLFSSKQIAALFSK